MRVLVTGAGGFIGGVVARHLAGIGHQVIANVHRRAPITMPGLPGIELWPGDMREAAGWDLVFDALVHCAAALPSRIADPDLLFAINVEGVRALLTCARRCGAGRVVNLSSMSVYGPISVPVVNESTPCRPGDAYGRGKLAAEGLVGDWAAESPGRHAVSLRLPGVVGAGSHDNFLSSVVARVAASQKVAAANPASRFNNVLCGAALAKFVEHLLSGMPTGHRAFPLAAESDLTVQEVLEILLAALGRPLDVTFREDPRPAFLIGNDAAKAVGYRPESVRGSLESYAAELLRADT